MNKVWLKGTLRRTVLVFTVLLGLWAAFVGIPRLIEQRQNVPLQGLIELRAIINEDYLALSAMANHTGQNSDVAQLLSQNLGVINQTTSEINEKLENKPSELDQELADQIKELLRRQNELINEFDGRYQVVTKALFYNPGDNLDLEIGTNKDLLVQRANNATEALKTLVNTEKWPINPENTNTLANNGGFFSLDQPTKDQLDKVITCLANFTQQVKSERSQQAKTTLQTCQSQYDQLRVLLTEVALAPFKTKDHQELSASWKQVLTTLDTKIRG